MGKGNLHDQLLLLLMTAIVVLSSRTARSEEDRDTLWDAWGSWSECSRTCGGGASYSLRRCLSSKTCEGQNIKYRTCSNVDCPPEAGDFRAQQCSAHADVRYQGQFHDWLPVYNDPENPCALKCKSKASALMVELAPKVLDGTRCYTESLDMCISGACQIVGCDHELGSAAKEDNCGVCNGDGSSCRLVRGHYKTQHASGKTEDTVVSIPYMSRHVRLVLKGPDHLYVESRTLQGVRSELALDISGQYHLENTTVDYQKLTDKEVLRIAGPLEADFTIKVQFSSGADSVVQYIYYQPIVHRWRETDFFPCSVTCGGGYQLTSAECFDLRSGRVVVDQYCHYYPENVKPKPKLQECNMEPCLASDGYKQIMPYDLYHPLPRWESSPWTACSTSCGGGIQSRSVTCVEEDMQGTITPTEEWKCLYSPKTAIVQPCNTFECPTWHAQEWSPCTVTCGQGLRYRVVLCIDHRGLHAGGCNPSTKPHIKEECLVTVPCFRSVDPQPVEAKEPWQKQAIELEEETTVTEEPTFISGPWEPCSKTCGAGVQRRTVRCQVLLSFSQTVADLPDDECEGDKPAESQSCYRTPCPGGEAQEERKETRGRSFEREELHDWEYEGFTECSESCGGGVQEAIVICLNKQTREAADQSLCESSRRPPRLLQDCNNQPCSPRWDTGEWSSCSATCGVGLMTRSVACTRRPYRHSNHTEVLKAEDCEGPKPSPVQACNRFDCPPMWDARDWGECSRSCGGGVQRRQVLCKQRLADGSVLELPDTFCPSKSPVSQQTCARQDCPAMWVTTEWSQCSVTCGTGTQRLQAMCRKQGEDGQYRTLHPKNCSQIAHPNSVRPCTLSLCENSIKPDATSQPPKKVYIQWRKGKKLHLLVGGYAYLLPWTPVVLRCPTRRFRKGHIHWLKDGKPLYSLTHLSITSLGYVKIYHLLPSDAGVYTCLDGQTREHLVVKIVGSKQKLSLSEAALSRLIGPQKQGQTALPISLNHYDNIAERIIGLKGSFQDVKDMDKLYLSDKDRSTLEDERGPFVLIVDGHKLDEIMRSSTSGEEQLAQLLNELAKMHSESNESTLHPETATQKPFGFSVKVHAPRPRRPAIVQQPRRAGEAPSSSEKAVHVGVPVLLQRPVASLELKCGTLGSPQPIIMWTKNGKAIQYNSRVMVLSSGSLKIHLPNKHDEGLYTCTARNRLGTATLSSWLQLNVGKGRVCAQGNNIRGHLCEERSNTSRIVPLCIGQFCSFRWQVEPWSHCSVACGGGSQRRRVRCVTGPDDRAKEVGSHHCTLRGPSHTRLCNMLPCVRWAATPWGQCHGQCVGSSLATQHRHVYCQDTNGTKVSYRHCSGLQRPISVKNCSTDACALQWRIGPWTQCTASCGRHGFQSRLVTCVHRRTGKATREHHCMWRPRPSSWQRCNVLSCGRAGECRDSTRYCDKVRQLELCPLPQFKSRCCHSCRNT